MAPWFRAADITKAKLDNGINPRQGPIAVIWLGFRGPARCDDVMPSSVNALVDTGRRAV